MAEAEFRFAVEDGKIKIRAEAEGQVVEATLSEQAVTSAFIFASRSWSEAIRGALEIRRKAALR